MNLFLIFQYCLIGAFVVLFVAFTTVMVFESAEECISQLLGLYAKNEILKFLGIGMGGVLLALQALMSYKRAKALEDTANAQAEAAKAQAKATEEQAKANQNTEQGQRQERLKNSIEHLGHASDSVRLGGAYELFHLAQDTKDLRQTVLDILCAHIRRTTGEGGYQKKYKSKPSEEIQSLLTLLFVQPHEVFKGLPINLQGSWLNGADLQGAYLEKAVLTKARLQEADLSGAHQQGADLREAYLQGADLSGAHLQGTDLSRARLQRAILLYGANLQGSLLRGTYLQKANLGSARLQGSLLPRAKFQGAELSGADLRGAGSQGNLSYTFAQRMRASAGKESTLAVATFEGGLSREDVESLVEDLPSSEEANELRDELIPHIGQPPSYELPENSGAITGAYTAEEAEQWIAEYNEAMSEVPEKGNN